MNVGFSIALQPMALAKSAGSRKDRQQTVGFGLRAFGSRSAARSNRFNDRFADEAAIPFDDPAGRFTKILETSNELSMANHGFAQIENARSQRQEKRM